MFNPTALFDRSGDTLLHIIARFGHLKILKHLLDHYKVDLEVANLDAKRPLHEAAQTGHSAIVAFLLEKGANVDSLKRADWYQL